jgi:TRAP-type C4-dicarboxylate transport system permease small subunit
MYKESLLFFCGVLVFGTPLIGVPLDWKETALYILGALVMFIALICRIERRRRERREDDAVHEEHDPRIVQQADVVPVGYEVADAYEQETEAK